MVALGHKIREPVRPPVGGDGIRTAARGRGASPRQVLFASLIGAFVLALFAAPDLPRWAGRLEDGPTTPLLREAAYRWDRAMSGLGLAVPIEALRRAVRRFKHYDWP
ncbi:MAG TPA: hypothetical protein VGR91_06885 [Stellaceae bacterium]|nr:hypothetical protein [Stellaceae bacterium]